MTKGFIDNIADSIVDSIIDSIGEEKVRGRYGEHVIKKELRFSKLFGMTGKILSNLYLPKTDGETTEIDVLYITKKGIFVIECKNYSGWIFGNEKDYQWTQLFRNGKKTRFHNPIMQNRGHIKWLKTYLSPTLPFEVPMYSIIAFVEKESCDLKKITVESIDVYVVKSESIYATIRNIWKAAPDVLSSEDIDVLYY